MTLLHSKGHCWILHEICSNAIMQQPVIPSQITAYTMQQFWGFFYQCHGSYVRVQKGMCGEVVGLYEKGGGLVLPVVRMLGDAFDGKHVLVHAVTVRESYRHPLTGKLVDLRVGVVPVMYGWGATVQYLQGKSVRCKLVVYLTSMWEVRMGNVAMSRPVSVDLVRVMIGDEAMLTPAELNSHVFQTSSIVHEFYARELGSAGGMLAYEQGGLVLRCLTWWRTAMWLCPCHRMTWLVGSSVVEAAGVQGCVCNVRGQEQRHAVARLLTT
jgi:hypothetical protein